MKKRSGRRTRYPGITDLGDGKFRLRAYATGPLGRSEIERIVEVNSVDKALRLKVEIEDAMNASIDRAPHGRLSRYALDWLERKKTARRKSGDLVLCPTTRARYGNSIEQHIVPDLGHHSVEAINRHDVQRWIDELATRYATATVNGHLRVLRSLLRDAGNEEASRVRSLSEDDTRISDEEPNLLEGEEITRFLRAARAICPQHFALILVMLTTAMRISTALALRREDFQPKLGVVFARRRLSGGEVIEGVKRSRRARDATPLLPQVWRAVERYWSTFDDAQTASGLAFPSRNGGHRSRSLLNDWLPRIRNVAEIEKRFTPHGCRRTAANEYRRALGESLSMRIAGHTTIAMHQRYTMLGEDEARAAGERTFGSKLRRLSAKSGDRSGDVAKKARNRRK